MTERSDAVFNIFKAIHMQVAGRQVFLLLTNNVRRSTIRLFKKISECTAGMGDAYILYHQRVGQAVPGVLTTQNCHIFTDDILHSLQYTPIMDTLVPGSNHFPLLDFYQKNTRYDHYWVIEDDVRFTGDWSLFFQTFSALAEYDLITSHIRAFSEEPWWYWWKSLTHDHYFVPLEYRIRSFNPIYRISNTGLELVREVLDMKWSGHHEVLLPTIIQLGNLKLLDFGGTGRFVLPGFENRFYTSEYGTATGALRKGTMRFRPVRFKPGQQKNKLYHPVKTKPRPAVTGPVPVD